MPQLRAPLLGLLVLSGCTGEPLPSRTRQPVTAAPMPSPPVAEALGVDGHPEARLSTPWGTLTVVDDVLRLRDATRERVLDDGAIPELALSPDGRLAAWPRRTALGTEIVVRALPDGPSRVVGRGLQVADRPVFAPDGNALFFWGSSASDPVVGLYREGLHAADASPVRLTNVHLSGVSDPRFVPPPIDRISVRFPSPSALEYATPEGPVVVALTQERP